MRVPDTPSTPSSSKSPAMDNRSFLEMLDAKLNPHGEDMSWILEYPAPTMTTICRIRNRLELDLDDIEECALVLNDPRTSDGFLFTPKLFQALGDNPRAVWYGRHTLFIVGEPGSYSLLHWDRASPHYIAHYDPLQDRDDFTCPPGVQSLVMATFHQEGCPDLPIRRMGCPTSGRTYSAFYSLCFAQALLMGKHIPVRPLPKPFIQVIRNFHQHPAPPTSNVVQMRPIRRSAQGPLEWSLPDAKVSSTYLSEPCLIPPYSLDGVEGVDSVQSKMASPGSMPRDHSSSSGRIVPPATFGGEQDMPFPHGSLPVRSAPTNSGAAPGSIPTKGPSAKGKEPATSSTNSLSKKDKELEAGATNPPSAKGKERQGSWQERWCELVDNVKSLEAQEKLVGHLLAVKDHPPLLKEAFNKFAADENDALIANGKEPHYLPFKEFMLAGVNQHFKVKVREAKSKVSEMILEVTEAAVSKGQSADQSPEFHEMMSIYGERQCAYVPSLFAKILKYYQKSRAGMNNSPSAKGKEPAAASTNVKSGKEKESEASVTIGPSAKGEGRQVRLYEEVLAEYRSKGAALLKANSECKVGSAAILIARCRLGRKDFALSELKDGIGFYKLNFKEMVEACRQAGIFMSPSLMERFLNCNFTVEGLETEDFMNESWERRVSRARFSEVRRLEKELAANTEVQEKLANEYTEALAKMEFLDDARSGALLLPISETLMKDLENLFRSRGFLSYLKNHDSQGRAGENER